MGDYSIEKQDELSGAEKFGECICCGDNKGWYKISFNNHNQKSSIRICFKCLNRLEMEFYIMM